jgi:hypothetical protein
MNELFGAEGIANENIGVGQFGREAVVVRQMEDGHFWPAGADRLRHHRLRAPEREWMPDANDEFCFGWVGAIHSLEPRCFQ